MNADRSLLVGLLAVQLEFIDRRALLEAMRAWVPDKSRPLEELLVERKAITPGDKELLVSLAARLASRHGGDAGLSIASLAPGDEVLKELAALGDKEVCSTVDRVPSTLAVAPGDEPQPTMRGPAMAADAAFRKVRLHGKGGLGEVYLARDERLHREVALKEMQPKLHDDPHSQARFLREAEITASLQHPGVVPVHELSRDDQGRPFYTMKFIHGETLLDAIRRFHKQEASTAEPGQSPGGPLFSRQSVEFRRLLGRIIDVCNVVAYAHSRNVIHRDLKPANVMLGEYGETVIIDWGLARRTRDPATVADGADAAVTRVDAPMTGAGNAVGTPNYMSPEQARGLLEEVGPKSDVFSLGATLYHLLTGRPPYSGESQAQALELACAGKFTRPAKVIRGVPAPLESICLKAMRARPEDRYATAAELAADLEHWLADAPVSAHADSLPVRAGRWFRRRPRMLAASAAAAASLLLALSVGLALLSQAWQKTYDAQQAEARRAGDAMRFSHLATRAYARLFSAINFGVGDSPETVELQKSLLGTAVDGLAELSAEAERRQSSVYLRIASLVDLAGIYIHLDGQLEECRKRLELANRLKSEIPLADRESYLAQATGAQVDFTWGEYHYALGDLAQARTYLDRAMFRSKPLEEYPNAGRELIFFRASVASLLGRTAVAQGDYYAAQVVLERERELAEQMLQFDPQDIEGRFLLLDAVCQLSTLAHRQGDLPRLAEQARLARELVDRLTPADRAHPAVLQTLPLFFTQEMLLALSAGDVATAAQAADSGVEAARMLLRLNPNSHVATRILATALEQSGLVALMQADWESSRAKLLASLDLREKSQMTRSAFDDISVAQIHVALAGLALEDNDFSACQAEYDSAVAIFDRLEATSELGLVPAANIVATEARQELAAARLAEQSIDDPGGAVEGAGEAAPRVLRMRGQALARRARIPDSAATARQLLEMDPPQVEHGLYAAVILCDCAVRSDDASQPSRKEMLESAFEALLQSDSAGLLEHPVYSQALKLNPHLAPVRTLPQFQEWLESRTAAP
jgi:serine/threonine protein kinase